MKQYETKQINKQLQRYVCVPFALVMCLLMWGLPLSVAYLLTETPLEKLIILCQPQLIGDSFLGMGACVFLPMSVMEPCLLWICAGLKHAAIVSEFMCINPVVSGRYCFHNVIHPSGSKSPLQHSSLSPEGEDLIKTLILFTVQLWVSVLVPILCRTELPE